MLFMVMHKTDAAMERGDPPDRAIVTAMGRLCGELRAKGRFINGAGLRPSSTRVRLRLTNGEHRQTPGPLRGEHELTHGFAMLEVKTMTEAIGWATKLSRALGDVEVDVGPVVEAWDLGLVAKPAGEIPLRVLAIHKATAETESGKAPTADQRTALEAVIAEMKDAGVFLAAESLKPSSSGARLRASGGKHTWVDGPFAESKELLAGFALVDLQTWDDVKEWTDRYARILGDIEVDVRVVAGPET